MSTSVLGLILIFALAVLAPLLARGVRPVLRVPIVVFEIVLGILVGPSLLGWVEPGPVFDLLAKLGLLLLFFIAGTETDFPAVGARGLGRASLGWFLGAALAAAVGLALAPGEGAIVIAIALSSTTLGTLLPILRDAGERDTPFGRAVAAVGTVGEFLPLIAVSVFLSARTTPVAAAVLLGFVALTLLAIVFAHRTSHHLLLRVVRATLHTSDQFGVRFVLLLLAALVALSLVLDLDMLLGAFVAGILWRLVMLRAPREDAEAVESKIEAIAFGFLVPIFFIYTGVTFDLAALLASPLALALVPVFLLVLLVLRGGTAQVSAPAGATRRDRGALALLSATGLPIIVAVTAIGVAEGVLDPAIAAALVGAGMLSVLLFPALALTLRGDTLAAKGPVREL